MIKKLFSLRQRFLSSSSCTLAIVISGFVALIFSVSHRISTFNREGAELTKKIFELKGELAAADHYKAQSRWVGESSPRFEDRKDAADHLVERVEDLNSHFSDLVIEEVRFGSAAEMYAGEYEGYFDKSSVEFLMRGSEEEIVHLIHFLQQPENFTSVDQIAIEAGEKQLVCEIRASQWFQPFHRVRIPFPSFADAF